VGWGAFSSIDKDHTSFSPSPTFSGEKRYATTIIEGKKAQPDTFS